MKAIVTILLAGAACSLLVACAGTPSDGANAGFTAAACKADTCGAEAKKCNWGSSDTNYLGCLSDCDTLALSMPFAQRKPRRSTPARA